MTSPHTLPSLLRRTPWSRIDTIVCVLAFAVVVTTLMFTSQSVGFTRDEGYYFKAAELYWGFFEDLGRFTAEGRPAAVLDKGVIDKHYKYNHEHPVLVKNAFALSWGLLKKNAAIFSLHSSAFRFPAWLFAGLCAVLLFALGRMLLPRLGALLGMLMWLSMPRAFWHMHLACFDIPVCAAHLWLVLAYLRYRRTIVGAFAVGVAFGLAAAVKHNILVAPAFFVLHWLLVEAKGLRTTFAGFRLPPVPMVFFSLAFVGPLVFLLHWPYLWPAPIERIGWYLGFHLTHEHYPILWFGDLLTRPPFPISFPFVMSLVTIPLPIVVAMVAGTVLAATSVWRFFRSRRRGTKFDDDTAVSLGDRDADSPTFSPSSALLLLLNGAFPFALIALPSSPIFGGTKHWMNALPFLCVLGAWAVLEGLAALWQIVDDDRRWRAAVVVVLVTVCLPGFLITARVHPYGLSSYNSLVGFARGAANTGFQRTFWGYEPRLALDVVNDQKKRGARLHFGDTNRDDYKMYRRDGLLRKDIRLSGDVSGADMASVQPQGEFKAQWMKVQNRWHTQPSRVVHVEGVPLVTITERTR